MQQAESNACCIAQSSLGYIYIYSTILTYLPLSDSKGLWKKLSIATFLSTIGKICQLQH